MTISNEKNSREAKIREVKQRKANTREEKRQ